MKKRTRFLALILASVLTVSVTACGGNSADGNTADGNAAEAEAENAEAEAENAEAEAEEEVDPFAAAQENMLDVSSMDAETVMEMDMEMGANGETQVMESETVMKMSSFEDPLRLRMDMTVTVGMGEEESAVQDMSIYVETTEDGAYMMYLYDGSAWQTQEIAASDAAQYDAESDMNAYLNGDYNFEAQGTDPVNGAEAYKYSGAIVGDEMKEVLLSSGALDQFSSLGIDSSQLDGMLDDLGEIPIDLWIDAATYYPVKYEMDMTAVMDTLMSNVLAQMGDQAEGLTMAIPKMTISMTCSNYNAATEFEIPAEAKAE